MIPSPYQHAIFDWIEHGTGHALVDAVAGAGKTTVLIEGAKRLTTPHACFVAFNKVIAQEIATRLQAIGSSMQASTIHSLGNRCLGKTRIDGNKYTKLCRRYVKSIPDTVLKDTPTTTAVKYLRSLVHFSQLTMTDPTETHLLNLIRHYALDDLLQISAGNPLLWESICGGVSVVMEAGKEQYQGERIIDFNDMVCLPIVLGVAVPQFDFIFVDEAQDLNLAQLELVLACARGRLLFVGDKRQSLYGFAGADTESITTILTRTQARVFPLSICYRCPSLPITLAQQIHPSIQPSPTAERGSVQVMGQAEFLSHVQPEDDCAVLGRCTAPLVGLCLKLLQQGKKAKVRGRDIGASMLDIIERLKKAEHFHFPRLLELLGEYQEAHLAVLAAKPENDMAIDAFLDKVETVTVLYQAYGDQAQQACIEGFEAYINHFFSDEDERHCILLSTIHKAKGLEFDIVYVLPEKIPHPLAKNAWQYEQELNAEYVLLTRAKKAMYFIGRCISNLTLPSGEPDTTQKAGARPEKERLHIELSSDVAAYLRSLKGGDAAYLEALVRSDPQFASFMQHV